MLLRLLNTQPVLHKLLALELKEYEYIGQEKSTVGLITKEVQKVMLEIVKEWKMNDEFAIDQEKEETLLGVNYGQLGILNTKAIQEQQDIINNQ